MFHQIHRTTSVSFLRNQNALVNSPQCRLSAASPKKPVSQAINALLEHCISQLGLSSLERILRCIKRYLLVGLRNGRTVLLATFSHLANPFKKNLCFALHLNKPQDVFRIGLLRSKRHHFQVALGIGQAIINARSRDH